MSGCFLYKFVNSLNEVIYIGKTNNIINRIRNQHFSEYGHLPDECYNETAKIFYAELNNSDELSIYERYLINTLNPKFNSQYKNGSSFRFDLPSVKWKSFKNIREASKNEKVNRTTVSNQTTQRMLNIIESEVHHFKESHRIKFNEFIVKISSKSKIEIEEVCILLKHYILSRDRRTTHYHIKKLLSKYNLDVKISFDLEKDLNEEIKQTFLRYNLTINRHSVKPRKASPEEFFKLLLHVSDVIQTLDIHRNWIRDYMHAFELDYILNNPKQDLYLHSKNIETKTYYKLENHKETKEAS